MPNSPLKILIVEDSANIAEVMTRVLEPLKKRFPQSEIIVTPSLSTTLEIIAKTPPPDVVTLDLTLEDSALENTMRYVEQIEERSPVVIVTGGNVEQWSPMLKRRGIEVIEKGTRWLADNSLVIAIARAWMRGKTQEAQKVNDRIAVMRGLVDELYQTNGT